MSTTEAWLRAEAEIDVEDAEETAKEQARADEENASESDFGDDERGTHAIVAAAFAEAAAGVLESGLNVTAGEHEPGSDAEKNADEKSDEKSPDERGAVDANAVKKRKNDGALMGEIGRDAEGDGDAE